MRHNTLLEDAMEQLFYANMIASPRAESIDGSKSTLKMLGSFIGTSTTTKEHVCPKLWRNLYLLERG
jgi:hypothetical protein